MPATTTAAAVFDTDLIRANHSKLTSYNIIMSNSSSAKSSRGKVILITLIIAVLIAIGLYVAGLMKGRAQISDLQAQLAQSQPQMLIAQNRGYLMEARATLYHTAIDLDERN